jgi:hypothetical protein
MRSRITLHATCTTNGTQFAGHYMQATALLLDAVGAPNAGSFNQAHRSAVAAIGSAFTVNAPGGDLEWAMGQELARIITAAARKHGYKITG